MNKQTTVHAGARSQQRGIPPLVMQWLAEYGREVYDGNGAVKKFFDHRSRKQLARNVGAAVVGRLSSYLDTYLVEAVDGTIITVGHRTERIRRR